MLRQCVYHVADFQYCVYEIIEFEGGRAGPWGPAFSAYLGDFGSGGSMEKKW